MTRGRCGSLNLHRKGLAPSTSCRSPGAPVHPISFFEFFTAQIRNPNTRRAYASAAVEFFDWLAACGVTQITAIESVHVAAYIEQLQKARSAPTAKLRLAALRHLFDWMVIGQIMPVNPAAAVCKHLKDKRIDVIMRGQNWTPVKFSENCKFRCCFNWLWLCWPSSAIYSNAATT
jgi:Phage integrase, N-terminal SAM-like domain